MIVISFGLVSHSKLASKDLGFYFFSKRSSINYGVLAGGGGGGGAAASLFGPRVGGVGGGGVAIGLD